jgi:hypothetical protein
MLGWWYLSIGAAFTMLALRSLIRGDPRWAVVFRVLIAAGFFVLSVGTRRTTWRR